MRFDIAAKDPTNKIIFGIEIFHTHKTTRIEPRNDVPWVEITADDTIEIFGNTKIKETGACITLNDVGYKLCCYINSMPEFIVALKLGYIVWMVNDYDIMFMKLKLRKQFIMKYQCAVASENKTMEHYDLLCKKMGKIIVCVVRVLLNLP